MNTNGSGLSYMHSGLYGMYAFQEGVRQTRGILPVQVPGARISVFPGVADMCARHHHVKRHLTPSNVTPAAEQLSKQVSATISLPTQNATP